MFWREDDDSKTGFQVPEDVFDLVFKLSGSHLEIDHAFALSLALQDHLGAEICGKIGVHGVSMAGSGNGWNRPEQTDLAIPLSRRARLVIRVHREDSDTVMRISDQTLQIGDQQVAIGRSSVRKLSRLGTLHASAVRCQREQSEADFLNEVAAQLKNMNIDVSKMICGKSRDIRAADEIIYSRALLIADLKPDESVNLQRQGIGDDRLLGCGLFVPHKGIDAVHNIQE